MRLSVLAIGRLKAGPEKTLADTYRERAEALGRKAGITRFTVADQAESQQATPAARMEEEARFFAEALRPRSFAIVLDERGQNLTSPAFSTLLRRQIDGGTPEVAFLIGGPDGHAQATRDQAGLLLSLGAMTWPHRLARVMLFEQIYRALTIMVNHPYHRG